MTRTSIRAFLLRIHFYGGMFVGPFILVAALTGCLYALAPTLENIVYRDSTTVAEVTNPVPLEQQVAAAEKAHPGLDVLQVWPANTPTDSTRVLLADPTIDETEDLAVFINPADASVIDAKPSYSGLGELPLRHWISALHQDFHLGKPGELYSELAASWLWILVLGGLYLWFIRAKAARIRRGQGRFSTLKAMLLGGARGVGKEHNPAESSELPETGGNAVAVSGTKARAAARKTAMKVHAATGTWLLVALLVLSATGITWSGLAGENVNKLVESMHWKATPIETSLHAGEGDVAAAGGGHEGHEGHGNHGNHEGHDGSDTAADGAASDSAADNPTAGNPVANASATTTDVPATQADTVYRAARDAGLTGPLRLYPPEDEHSGWKASERWVEWRTTSDQVSVDGSDGRIIDRQDFADLPTFSKLSSWGIYLHMGIMFGLPLQLLLFVVGLGLALMVVMGYRMWWKRRTSFVPGSPKNFSWQTTALGVLVVATVGVFLPLFGITLAAFLLVDVLVMGRRARKLRNRNVKIRPIQQPEHQTT